MVYTRATIQGAANRQAGRPIHPKPPKQSKETATQPTHSKPPTSLLTKAAAGAYFFLSQIPGVEAEKEQQHLPPEQNLVRLLSAVIIQFRSKSLVNSVVGEHASFRTKAMTGAAFGLTVVAATHAPVFFSNPKFSTETFIGTSLMGMLWGGLLPKIDI